MEIIIIIILLAVNLPVYKYVFGLFFDSKEDFDEAIRYVFTPNIFSLFKGEYMKDRFSEMKVGFFVACCLLIILVEFFIINGIAKIFI